jgi:ferredoxin-NADP reductase
MHTSLSVALSSLFVLLGGFNTWLMLGTRGSSKPNRRLLVLAHRTAGYLFIAIYSVMLYYMILRIKGAVDELPPRITVHMVLALLLVPLLVMKIFVARHQKSLQGVLHALGIAIFAISFTLVALNIVWHMLRSATERPVSPVTSAIVLILIFALLGVLLLRRPGNLALGQTVAHPIEDAHADGLAIANRDPKGFSLILSRIQPQTHDSKTLRFIVPQNMRWLARAGQFLTFEWMIDGKRVDRSYSICSSPTQTGYVEITPKRMPNGCVSIFLNDHVHPGLVVTARGPYGQFCFDAEKHKRIVLIAGGSGMTPMMSMLRYIDDLCLPVEVTFIYCVRTQDDVFFKAELAELQARLKKFRYILVLSQPGSDWKGPSGHLNRELIEGNVENIATATFFLCGPPPFMENTRKILESLAVDPANVKQESFGSARQVMQTDSLESRAFQIAFVRSNKTCRNSQSRTILETAEMNGVNVPYGCRQGQCGTCVTRLLAGEVQMEREDGLGTELKAQGYILPCVSRARSDIELDV